MNNLIRFIRMPILLLLPLLATHAQEILIEEEPEIRRYTVEMIIFRYAQDVGIGTEIFVGEKLMPDEAFPIDNEMPLLNEAREFPEEDREAEAQVPRENEFVLLDKEDYTMNDIMGHLRRLDVYEPLMHFGWTQTTWPEEETQTIELASLAPLPPGLDGNLMLYLSRYLHLVVNLELDAPGTSTNSLGVNESYSEYGDFGAADRFGSVEPRRGPVRYRIEEDRIFRSGELRYFDHPKFGVLARVTRLEEEPEETGDTELLGYPAE